MEAFLQDARSGEQHAIDIGLDARPVEVKRAALQAFPYHKSVKVDDLQLTVDGRVLCDGEPLGSAAGVESGCTVDVQLSYDRFLKALRAGASLSRMPAWVQSHRTAALAAVQQDPTSLKGVNDELRHDKDFFIQAMQMNPLALKYAPDSMRADWHVVLAALQMNTDALCYAQGSLKADRELILEAVCINPFALKHAHPSLLADRGVVLAAVSGDPYAVKYAHPSLLSDPEIVAAAQTQPDALSHALVMQQTPGCGVSSFS